MKRLGRDGVVSLDYLKLWFFFLRVVLGRERWGYRKVLFESCRMGGRWIDIRDSIVVWVLEKGRFFTEEEGISRGFLGGGVVELKFEG